MAAVHAAQGVKLTMEPGLREALRSLGADPSLTEDVRREAKEVAEAKDVAWQRLRPLYFTARERLGAGFSLQRVCAEGGVVLPALARRERSAALEARCAQLRKRLEQQQYDALVHDITQPERDAAAASEGGLVTFRQQIGYGVHVLVMMGTFYALGHYAAAHVSRSAAHHAAGGLAGLVFAMLMEAVLLIIRTSVPYELPRRATLTLAAAPPGGARRGGGAGGAEEPEQAAAARRAPGRRRAPRQEAALKKAQ